MEEATKEISAYFGPWGYLLVPAVVAIAGAIVTAIGWISKRFVRGATYYVDAAWKLLDKAANKHFEFVDSTSEQLAKQTGILEQIEKSTEATSATIGKLGSDPIKTMEDIKTELIEELTDAMVRGGLACKYQSPEDMQRDIEKIVSHQLKKREKPHDKPDAK